MTTKRKKPVRRDPDATKTQLLNAAEREFNLHGFDGTDTNRIARAAGFAPQTFYRHFEDKTAIFLGIYDRWWKSEVASLESSVGSANSEAAARVALSYHTKWRGFRRSLRHLAIIDPKVRKARTAARQSQIARWVALSSHPSEGDKNGAIAGALLTTERLCDAVAEGELADLGVSARDARILVARAIAVLMAGGGLSEPGSEAPAHPH
jgi:AcrR family transcriptional regulator